MSWQVGTLVILLLALGGGMIWYETSRPPSQIVALVAVLAALAVAGRIVLAPIPNVVATTDIVLFSGYALGPAPGFAVGALGGLVSNFWLGQGIWTPWQMVAWGMTGVAGGVLYHLTKGRANRFTLALACGAAGLVFGAWMNFQTMVSFGGEISLDRYLVLEVRAIPFDLAHITGNVIFALAAGPTMIAALRRFRERFEWQQASSIAGVMLVAIALTTVLTAPSAKAATTDQAAKAAIWL
ncbi:MAG TPA: ECF transporter S component, partial [Solirubrobacterales bacterium]|nr:ECF transporter S component [Solirubrobacterales bacterium]